MAALRIIFMGTPELAGEILRALQRNPAFELVAAVTQPDQPKGRGLKLQPCPVKQEATRSGVPVLQPERARDPNFIDELRRLKPDLIVVAAYGQLLPQAILDLPRFGCVNVHTSLLPKYRGAAPIQWAILNGETETGITIMKMDAGMDTGPILSQQPIAIGSDDASETLHDRLAQVGGDLLVRTIPGYITGEIKPRAQPAEGASHAPKIRKQDGRVDWNQPASAIRNRIRAMIPWPGAFARLPGAGGGWMLKIWNAAVIDASGSPGTVVAAGKDGILIGCGSGALRVLELQREGGKRMTAADFLAGHPLEPGVKFE